ncbi:MAG: tetratricopeptide repeat protein [Chitinophagaceae bacterium]
MDRIIKIKEMLQTTPKDSFLRHALALEYIKIGKNAIAKEVFEQLLTDDPDYVGSYYHLAKLLEAMNDKDAAIHWYEKGMAIAKQRNERHAYNELQSAYEELIY